MSERRDQAKALRSAKKYAEALPLYEQLWKVPEGGEPNKWDGWAYALCLRKTGRAAEALDICRDLFRGDPEFANARSLYAWCIYDTEVKVLPEDANPVDEERFLKAASAIIGLTKQEDFSPYSTTALKVVRFLARKPNQPWRDVLEWLDLVNPEGLSCKAFASTDQRGRPVEIPSDRDTFFLKKATALLHVGRLQECLATVDEALREGGAVSVSTKFWLERIQMLALSASGQSESALEIGDRLLKQREEWFLLHEVAEIELRLGHHARAWELGLRALLLPGPIDMKGPLLEAVSEGLLGMDRSADAAQHVQLGLALRYSRGWKVNDRLRRLATAVGIDSGTAPRETLEALETRLRDWWREQDADRFATGEGVVDALLPHGKAGFIKSDAGLRLYFQVRSLEFPRRLVKPGQRVVFRIKPSFDAVRQRPSVEAIHIKLGPDAAANEVRGKEG